MKNLKQIENSLEKEVIKYFETGKDGMAVTIQKKGELFYIIASWGSSWEHVSMSLKKRCPVWDEMCWLKDLFWNNKETVIQFHPPEKQYINNHPYCLHLWKPQKHTIPLPPSYLVGIK